MKLPFKFTRQKEEVSPDKEISKYYTCAHEAANIKIGYALVGGVILTILTYLIIFALRQYMQSEWIDGFTDMFVERGIIPYLTTFCFWLGISGIVLKRKKIRAEDNGFLSGNQILKNPAEPITTQNAPVFIERINELDQRDRKRIIVNRIEMALQRLVNTKSASDVDNILSSLSEIDNNVIESSYSMVRYLVWIIPTLGFIGTVVGIGNAIGGFAKVIPTVQDFAAIKPELTKIAWNLGVAFDTTLVALGLSVILVLVISSIQKREEDLLSSIDDFCMAKVVNRLTNRADPNTHAIINAINKANVDSIETFKKLNFESIRASEISVDRMTSVMDGISQDNLEEMAENLRNITQEMAEVIDKSIGGISGKRPEVQEVRPTQEFKEVLTKLETITKTQEGLSQIVPILENVGKMESILLENQNMMAQLQQILEKQSEVMHSSLQTLEANTQFFKKNQEVMEQLHAVIQKLSEEGVPISVVAGGRHG